MKKAFAYILALLLLLSMTACRSGNGDNEYSDPYEPETNEYENSDDSIALDPVADEPEEEEPTLANMALTGFSFYSDGVAWATVLEADGQERTCAVDEAGNILFTLEEDPYYTSDFYDGVAFYRVSTKGQYSYSEYSKNLYLCYEVIIDKQGNELYRTEFDEPSRTWEHILGYDDGRFMVAKYTSSITEADVSFYVMDTHCDVIDGPVAGKQLIEKELIRNDFNAHYFLGDNALEYFGEGWYTLYYDNAAYHTFNLNTVRWLDGRVPAIPFENGTAVMAWHDIYYTSDYNSRDRVDLSNVARCDTNMNVLEEYDGNSGIIANISEVRDGLIRNYENYYTYSEVWFTDLLGNTVLDLRDLYPDSCKDVTCFHDGYAILNIIGADGNYYATVLDSNGTSLFEPIQQCAHSYNYEENSIVFVNDDPYLLLYDRDEALGLYDMNGTLLHNISADWETYETNSRDDFDVTVTDGIVRLQYEETFKELGSDDITLYKVFPVTDWIEAGSNVYELEFINPFETTSNGSAEAETETSSKDYVTLSDFTIEGKWKSVGDYGFGQAQPGAIVVFDGSNCNFFSPQDTYALYQDGDTYKLDVTSFMSTDTLTFTIKTVDNNHIDVFYGGQITELQRMD